MKQAEWSRPELVAMASGAEAEANKRQSFEEAPAESGTTGEGNPGGGTDPDDPDGGTGELGPS